MGNRDVAPNFGDPGAVIMAATARTLELAHTWLRWDGRPRVSDDGERIYTPHKAIRRYADHLIDHLAQIQALLAGTATEPDGWHGSLVTLATDWPPFTEADLVEAQQRLRRLSVTFAGLLTAAGEAEWDRPRSAEWTLRQIAEHAGAPWYAEQVGDLSQT